MNQCPKCGSSDVKKRPFTAPTWTGIFCVVFGIMGFYEVSHFTGTGHNLDGGGGAFLIAGYSFLPAVFVIFGIVAIFRKRYLCLRCKKVFDAGDAPSSSEGNVKVRCPKCRTRLKGATADMIGDIGVCPKCKHEFTIVQQESKRV